MRILLTTLIWFRSIFAGAEAETANAENPNAEILNEGIPSAENPKMQKRTKKRLELGLTYSAYKVVRSIQSSVKSEVETKRG